MPNGLVEADVIAISGHREGYARSEMFRGLRALRANEYIFGGARGVDSEALDFLGRTQNAAWRTVIVPNRVADQPAVARTAIAAWADDVVELRNTGPGRFQIRNRAMVDRADRLAAFYDFRGRGGTYNTIEYARAVDKAFSVVPVQANTLGLSPYASIGEIEAYARQLELLHLSRENAKGIIFGLLKGLGVQASRVLVDLFRAWRW